MEKDKTEGTLRAHLSLEGLSPEHREKTEQALKRLVEHWKQEERRKTDETS